MIYYVTAVTTVVSAVLGLMFSIQAVRGGKGKERQNALYMMARSAACVVISVVPLLVENFQLLALVTGAMLVIQLIDGAVGIYIKDRMRTVGPFFMAALHAACLWMLVL